MTSGQTCKFELQKAAAASSSTALPPGWRAGNWVASTVTREMLAKYAAEGLFVEQGWRIPDAGEMEPNPRTGERALLTTHLDRGFSLPPHPFFKAFLHFYGAHLHHLPPNAIAHLSCFISCCETSWVLSRIGRFGGSFSTPSPRW